MTGWLAAVSLKDRNADQVTEALIEAVLGWAVAQRWRVYRGARSVVPLSYADRHSTVDVGVARDLAAPIVVEVDRSDRKRTVEKLVAEAAAGRVALWVRWGAGPFLVPPDPVRLVPYPTVARKASHGVRLYSSPGEQRQAPEHSGVDLTQAQQNELFGPL
ncbi:hypothetical protein Rhe02_50380 [Rhizocola hellebori]|uniref:Uncharacterized protein n=1 Tax=Rhizocola hellebori TaxID=1392758 RepID=A0A8J3VIE3_9ACTN|nr:hypothetical protein Rhe02_50380 [Rhizocola hellebori]